VKYEIIKLDGRFSYRYLFEYAIKFSTSMASGNGPVEFNDALKWFYETYGWSAEVRSYDKILSWVHSANAIASQPWASRLPGVLTELPIHCNPHWSWTNGYEDSLRIYVKSAAELNFFQLKWPNEKRI